MNGIMGISLDAIAGLYYLLLNGNICVSHMGTAARERPTDELHSRAVGAKCSIFPSPQLLRRLQYDYSKFPSLNLQFSLLWAVIGMYVPCRPSSAPQSYFISASYLHPNAWVHHRDPCTTTPLRLHLRLLSSPLEASHLVIQTHSRRRLLDYSNTACDGDTIGLHSAVSGSTIRIL